MILSASRRTDIPAFYMPWFMERLVQNCFRVVNPFNPRQTRLIPISPEQVDAIVFWTRAPHKIEAVADQLERLGYDRTTALVTITGYGRELEPRAPDPALAMEGVRGLAARWGGPERVIWRYDPILLGPKNSPQDHCQRFEKLAAGLEGAVQRVIVSFIDLYRKTARRLKALGNGGYPLDSDQDPGGKQGGGLLKDLAGIAARRGMELMACAEPPLLLPSGVRPGRCIDPLWLAQLFPARPFQDEKDRGQRPFCGCCPAVDVGMPDSCLFGCVYCYAVRSDDIARKNHSRHCPTADSLLPLPEGD